MSKYLFPCLLFLVVACHSEDTSVYKINAGFLQESIVVNYQQTLEYYNFNKAIWYDHVYQQRFPEKQQKMVRTENSFNRFLQWITRKKAFLLSELPQKAIPETISNEFEYQRDLNTTAPLCIDFFRIYPKETSKLLDQDPSFFDSLHYYWRDMKRWACKGTIEVMRYTRGNITYVEPSVDYRLSRTDLRKKLEQHFKQHPIYPDIQEFIVQNYIRISVSQVRWEQQINQLDSWWKTYLFLLTIEHEVWSIYSEFETTIGTIGCYASYRFNIPKSYVTIDHPVYVGDSISLKVYFAFYDDTEIPIVHCSNPDATIHLRDGVTKLTIPAEKNKHPGKLSLKGTMSYTSRNSWKQHYQWEKNILVITPKDTLKNED